MEEQIIDIELKKINLPKTDYTVYVGKKGRIAKVDTMKGQYGYYLKLTSDVVDIKKFGKEDKEILATKILGLFEDEEGVVGWGEETKTGEYLKTKGVSHPDELLGREVIIQINNKNGENYLTFI